MYKEMLFNFATKASPNSISHNQYEIDVKPLKQKEQESL